MVSLSEPNNIVELKFFLSQQSEYMWTKLSEKTNFILLFNNGKIKIFKNIFYIGNGRKYLKILCSHLNNINF